MALSYFINRKKTICVVTFQGSFTQNDVGTLENCLNEIRSEASQYVILNLGGVSAVDQETCRPLTLFQNGIRVDSKLYLCSIQENPGKLLRGAGVLRESEVVPDLLACLQNILAGEKGK